MEIFILIKDDTYEYLGAASTLKRAEKEKTILLEELPMMEPHNIIILKRTLK